MAVAAAPAVFSSIVEPIKPLAPTTAARGSLPLRQAMGPAFQPGSAAAVIAPLAPAHYTPIPPPLLGAFPPLLDATGAAGPQTQLDAVLEARIANVPLGLPPVLEALVRHGLLSQAERRQHMVQFRAGRGSHNERERKTLARLIGQVGPAAMADAARAAAMAKLGLARLILPSLPAR